MFIFMHNKPKYYVWACYKAHRVVKSFKGQKFHFYSSTTCINIFLLLPCQLQNSIWAGTKVSAVKHHHTNLIHLLPCLWHTTPKHLFCCSSKDISNLKLLISRSKNHSNSLLQITKISDLPIILKYLIPSLCSPEQHNTPCS